MKHSLSQSHVFVFFLHLVFVLVERAGETTERTELHISMTFRNCTPVWYFYLTGSKWISFYLATKMNTYLSSVCIMYSRFSVFVLLFLVSLLSTQAVVPTYLFQYFSFTHLFLESYLLNDDVIGRGVENKNGNVGNLNANTNVCLRHHTFRLCATRNSYKKQMVGLTCKER